MIVAFAVFLRSCLRCLEGFDHGRNGLAYILNILRSCIPFGSKIFLYFFHVSHKVPFFFVLNLNVFLISLKIYGKIV